MSGVIRVGVLDEHEVVRQGLRAHLSDQPGMAMAGLFDQASEAWQAIERDRVDVLLMDYELEKSAALDFIKTIRSYYPQVSLLAFVAEPLPSIVMLLLGAGVHGIVCKRQPLDVVVQAIRALASGQRYRCSNIAGTQAQDDEAPQWAFLGAEDALASHVSLSMREREVLRLCISGYTVTRIAEMFNRSLKTVSTQKLAAYRKLGVKNDMELFKRLSHYNNLNNF